MKRISILAFILCACFVSVAWGQQPAGKCINNWSEFHRTNMKRWNPCEKVLNVHNVGSLHKLWSYPTGGPSSPAVAKGVVYVGSCDGNLYALNAKTRALLWSYPTGGCDDFNPDAVSSPGAANGVVYVGGNANNSVYALNAKTGALRWSYATAYRVYTAPTVANGVVYVGDVRQGKSALTLDEQRRIHPGREKTIRAAGEGVGTGSAGGYLVPKSFADRFETILVQTDELFGLAMLFETRTGSTTGYPILDDTADEAAIVAEAGSSSEVEATFASLAFALCLTWRSGYMRASVELVNDSAFDLESPIAGAAGVRFARGVGAAFVATLLSSAAAGVTTASTTAITGPELIKLTGAINEAYLPNASFLMKRSTYVTLLQLVGSSGNFLFPAAFNAEGRPTLLGFRFISHPAWAR